MKRNLIKAIICLLILSLLPISIIFGDEGELLQFRRDRTKAKGFQGITASKEVLNIADIGLDTDGQSTYNWWDEFPQYPIEGQESITYEIEVDGNPVPKDGIVYVNSQTPEILILERMNVREPRDEDWLSGRGFIQDHVLEITGEYEETSTDGTTVSAAIYYLKNMVPYVPVKVMLTEELADRLGLETSELTIIKTFSEKGIS